MHERARTRHHVHRGAAARDPTEDRHEQGQHPGRRRPGFDPPLRRARRSRTRATPCQAIGSVREAREALEREHAGPGAARPQAARTAPASSCCARSSASSPRSPVIMMTAFGELETAVEAMSAGAFWFVKKPFQNEELLALVGARARIAEAVARAAAAAPPGVRRRGLPALGEPARCRRPTRSPSRWRAATPPAC